MVGWHHRLGGRVFEQAAGVGDGQGRESWNAIYSMGSQRVRHN